MDIHAGTVAIRTTCIVEAVIEPAVDPHIVFHRDEALVVDPEIGADQEVGILTHHIDIAANDDVFRCGKLEQSILRQGGQGPGQENAEGVMVGQVVGVPLAVGGKQAEIVGIVIIETIARRQVHGVTGGDGPLDQHLVSRGDIDIGPFGRLGHDRAPRRAVPAGPGDNGAAALNSHDIVPVDIDQAFGVPGGDNPAFHQGKGGSRVHIHQGTVSIPFDQPGHLDGGGCIHIDGARIVQPLDDAAHIRSQTVGSVVVVDDIVRTGRAVDGNLSGIVAPHPTADDHLLIYIEQDLFRPDTGIGKPLGVVQVLGVDLDDIGIELEPVGRSLHIPLDGKVITVNLRSISEAGVNHPRQTGSLDHLRSHDVAEDHGITRVAPPYGHQAETVRQSGQIPGGEVERRVEVGAVGVVIDGQTEEILRCRAHGIDPGDRMGANGQRARTDQRFRTGQEVHIVGGKRNVACPGTVEDLAGLMGQAGIYGEQGEVHIAPGNDQAFVIVTVDDRLHPGGRDAGCPDGETVDLVYRSVAGLNDRQVIILLEDDVAGTGCARGCRQCVHPGQDRRSHGAYPPLGGENQVGTCTDDL